MSVSRDKGSAGQGYVEGLGLQALSELSLFELSAPSLESRFNRALRLIGDATYRRALVGRQPAHLGQRLGQLAFPSQIPMRTASSSSAEPAAVREFSAAARISPSGSQARSSMSPCQRPNHEPIPAQTPWGTSARDCPSHGTWSLEVGTKKAESFKGRTGRSAVPPRLAPGWSPSSR